MPEARSCLRKAGTRSGALCWAKAAARASAADIEESTMSMFRAIWGALVVLCTATSMTSIPAAAQQGQQPDIVFIMGDSALGAPATAYQYD